MSLHLSGLVLGDRLGSGHFGEVFRGVDEVHGDVAVKVMRRRHDELSDAWAKRRDGLRREAQHLARATHRNVVQVHHCDVADDGECIRFCMALCSGGSLQSRFEHGPMPVSYVRQIATDVTLGLQALHQRQMLHRDIKPANILLDAQGAAKLGDFGLVTDDLLLGYGSAAGYRDHLAYEVWKGSPTSVKTDIWALGMTIFRMLHGKAWYEAYPAPKEAIQYGGFVNTLKWLPHTPTRWRRVIRKMMNDSPADRYQNCEQLLRAFAELPVEPDWECQVLPEVVRWSRETKGRVLRVEWARPTKRGNRWQAWSDPVGSGRKRWLGGSKDLLGTARCVSELNAFFNS